jgi:hypothetical protein
MVFEMLNDVALMLLHSGKEVAAEKGGFFSGFP